MGENDRQKWKSSGRKTFVRKGTFVECVCRSE